MKILFSLMKIQFKSFMSSLPLVLVMFIGLPIGLSYMSSKALSIAEYHESENVIFYINDLDKTDESENLIDALEASGAKIYESSDLEFIDITIKKGYSNALIENQEFDIELNDDENLFFAKNIIDNYHTAYNLNNQGIENNMVSFEPYENVDNKYQGSMNSSEMLGFLSMGFIGMLIGMLIVDRVQAQGLAICKAFSIRINSTANSKAKIYLYEFLANFLNIFIVLSIYVLFFRILGVSFLGNLFIIILMVIVVSVFTTSIALFFAQVLNRTVALILGMGVMLISMLATYSIRLSSLDFLSKINPVNFITNMFLDYSTNLNSIDGLLSIILILCLSIVVSGVTLGYIRYKRVLV